jgi:hypothetical protein
MFWDVDMSFLEDLCSRDEGEPLLLPEKVEIPVIEKVIPAAKKEKLSNIEKAITSEIQNDDSNNSVNNYSIATKKNCALKRRKIIKKYSKIYGEKVEREKKLINESEVVESKDNETVEEKKCSSVEAKDDKNLTNDGKCEVINFSKEIENDKNLNGSRKCEVATQRKMEPIRFNCIQRKKSNKWKNLFKEKFWKKKGYGSAGIRRRNDKTKLFE